MILAFRPHPEKEHDGGLPMNRSQAQAEAPAPPLRSEGLPFRTLLGYDAGNFAFALLGLVVAVNLQFFYTDYVGLSAGLVSWSLLIARMFDAVTDPVMGYMSDRTHSRIGRRRPYVIGSALPLGVALYLLFSPPVVEDSASHQLELPPTCSPATWSRI